MPTELQTTIIFNTIETLQQDEILFHLSALHVLRLDRIMTETMADVICAKWLLGVNRH